MCDLFCVAESHSDFVYNKQPPLLILCENKKCVELIPKKFTSSMGPYFVIGHDYREKVNKITKTILKHNISEVNDMIFNALIKRHNYELVKYYIDSGCCINNVDWSTAIYCITSYKILLKNNRVKTLYNNTFYKYKIINYIMRIDVDRYLRCNYRHPQYVVLIKELLNEWKGLYFNLKILMHILLQKPHEKFDVVKLLLEKCVFENFNNTFINYNKKLRNRIIKRLDYEKHNIKNEDLYEQIINLLEKYIY